jgi:hypothetical protein
MSVASQAIRRRKTASLPTRRAKQFARKTALRGGGNEFAGKKAKTGQKR